VNTATTRPARTEAQQRAVIRFAAARAAMAAKRIHDPLDPASAEAERYYRNLNGGN